MSKCNCPKCGADISDSYQGDEPDVGIVGGYYCDKCDLGVPADDYEPYDDDVQIFGTEKVYLVQSHLCEHCKTPLEAGYGLAGGGGVGPYMYCPNERCFRPTFVKSKDPEM